MVANSRHVTTVKRQKVDKPNFIILSAGIGTRAKSYGVRALWEIKHEALIIHQIKVIRSAYPGAEITVVVGFEADKVIERIERLGIKLIENQLYESQGQLGSLRLGLLSSLNEEVCIIHGDILFNKETIENITHGASKLIVDSYGRIEENKVGVRGHETAEHIGYCWHTKWAQICCVKGNELDILREYTLNKANSKLLTYEALEHIIENNGKLFINEPNKASFKEINTIKDI